MLVSILLLLVYSFNIVKFQPKKLETKYTEMLWMKQIVEIENNLQLFIL